MKKNISLLIFALISATGFLSAQDTAGSAISPKKFEKKIEKKKAIVLDVRTPEEYKAGYIPKAVNYNIKDSLNFVQALQALDKNKKYFLYCGTGRRSGRAIIMMKQIGFTQVHHLAGGITNWKGEIKKPG